jgi:hypothetical protein
MFPHQPQRFHQVLRLHSVILRQGNRKEEEAQVAVTKDRRAHAARMQTAARG